MARRSGAERRRRSGSGASMVAPGCILRHGARIPDHLKAIMSISRRSLIQATAAGVAAGLAPLPGIRHLLFAAEPESDRILVLLHLRGGCDGLNLLSPASDADFIEARNSDLRVLAEGSDAGHAIVHAQAAMTEFRLH